MAERRRRRILAPPLCGAVCNRSSSMYARAPSYIACSGVDPFSACKGRLSAMTSGARCGFCCRRGGGADATAGGQCAHPTFPPCSACLCVCLHHLSAAAAAAVRLASSYSIMVMQGPPVCDDIGSSVRILSSAGRRGRCDGRQSVRASDVPALQCLPVRLPAPPLSSSSSSSSAPCLLI